MSIHSDVVSMDDWAGSSFKIRPYIETFTPAAQWNDTAQVKVKWAGIFDTGLELQEAPSIPYEDECDIRASRAAIQDAEENGGTLSLDDFRRELGL